VAVSWQLQEAKQKFSDLVLAAPVARRWIERTFGAILIGFAAKLAFTDR
jgi:threonine/homoserine/homoserine lactone efflux protein